MSLFVIDTKGDNEVNLNLRSEAEEISENEVESESDEDEPSQHSGSGGSSIESAGDSSSESDQSGGSSSEPGPNACHPSLLKKWFKGPQPGGQLFPLTTIKRSIRKPKRSASTKEEEKVIHDLSVAKTKHQDATPKTLIDILSKNLILDDEGNEEDDEDFIVMPRGSDDDSDDAPVIIREIPTLLKLTTNNSKNKKIKKKKHEDYDFNEVLIEYDKGATETLKNVRSEAMHKMLKEKSIAMDPGLERMECVPSTPYFSARKLRKLSKAERAKTKGGDWFNLPATEVTEEVQRDLEVLQMRSILDPKTFYKKNDLKVLPKYFQIGHVEDNAADFYHSRIPKKDRKRTMVEELMADAEFQKRSKHKFKEIVQEKKRVNSKAHREARRLKKRKK